MANVHESGADKFFRVVAPKLTSVGAAIVIVGALFKIMHWPGAGMMLTVGLLTEAFLFFLGAFQPSPPPEAHYDWERVYPELSSGESHAELPENDDSDTHTPAKLAMIDQWLVNAGLNEDTFTNFGKGMTSLKSNVDKMKDVSNASLATDEYAKSAKIASQNLNKLSDSYSGIVKSMTAMAQSSQSASKDAEAYHKQVQGATKSLASLNAVYELELKDAKQHIQSMNKFYGNLSVAMSNMSDVSKESETFKKQMVNLTGNLTQLNNIYGNMLSAMKG